MIKRRILFVCLGNICRSPMAEGVFKQLLKDCNLIQSFELDSAGTGAYHIGSNPDQRAISTCAVKGIELVHKARQVIKDDVDVYDYILAMDARNYQFLKQLFPDHKGLKMMRDFDPQVYDSKDVPDPYYGGIEGFEEVYDILLRSSKGFLEYLVKEKK